MYIKVVYSARVSGCSRLSILETHFFLAEGNEIVDTPTGTLQCTLYEADLDPDQSGDRMARRDLKKRQTLEGADPDAVTIQPNSTSLRLPPFHVLDSQRSNMKSCNNFVTIPNYDRVPITGYYDFDLPAALHPELSSYATIPINLQNADGTPGLVVRPGVSVYGREHMYVLLTCISFYCSSNICPSYEESLGAVGDWHLLCPF